MQTTDTILLVRPHSFRRNEQTALDNHFQAAQVDITHLDEQALLAFDEFAENLRAAGLQLIILQDKGMFDTLDSIFPNNTISFHQNKAILYPMLAPNRRKERAMDYIGQLNQLGFPFAQTIDYTSFEKDNQFLEGSGAIVFDRVHKITYCSISQRADPFLFELFCEQQGCELPIG